MKNILLFLIIPILSFGQTQIGNDIDGEFPEDRSGSSVSLSSDGNVLAIGATGNDTNGEDSGHVRIYENNNGDWIQLGFDLDGVSAGDQFGNSISLSSDGSIIAVGAQFNGNNTGHVRIYERDDDGFYFQIGEDIFGEAANDEFGTSVSLSSNGLIVAIGARGNDGGGNGSGHVRVFENNNGNWVQVGEDIDGESETNESGISVSLSNDGNIIAIGSPGNDDINQNSGQVRIYGNQGGSWAQIGQDLNGEFSNDLFGTSVSLSNDGNIVAIGAPENDSNGTRSGQVKIFSNQNDTWTQLGDNINGEAADDESGNSLSLSGNGNVVAIGARFNDGDSSLEGHVRIFENINNQWIQAGQDINGDEIANASGSSVSLSNDSFTVAIGSIFNNGNGANSGHVRVFDLSGILSTEEVTATNFSIFPNPSQNIVSISLSNSDILQKATIYNNLGQEILESTQNSIDVSLLPKGVYILEVETARGKGSEKLIIN